MLQPTQAHGALTGYQAAVTADSPYEYYRFNETGIGPATSSPDASGNSHAGTYQNSPQGGSVNYDDFAVAFNSGVSSTGNAAIVSYQWDFGDGYGSTSANPSHTYTTPG